MKRPLWHCARCNGNKLFPRPIVSAIDPMTGNSARREGIMANDRDNHEDGVSRRHALECMVCAGTGILWLSADVPGSLSLLGRAGAAPAIAQTKPTIPIIVKDTTSIYWQTVLDRKSTRLNSSHITISY